MAEILSTNVNPRAPAKASAQSDISLETPSPVSTRQLAVWALLATVSMLFAGFASAYLVRRAGTDWQRIPLPAILWVNTLVLLASSGTMEAARTAPQRGAAPAARRWLAVTALLGLAFLGGQFSAWRQLAAQGVYLPTNPYSSFFYMLTAVHGVRLLGGIGALGYALWRVSRADWNPAVSGVLDGCATYWHFVDGIWVFLYLLLLLY